MTGRDLKVHFIHSGGTADLSGDFRNFEVTREQKAVDLTAANDAATYEKPTTKMFSAKLDALYIGTAGTAVTNQGGVDLGTEGTLIYSPQGTATGKPKGSFPCYVKKADVGFAYDGTAEVKFEFGPQGNETANVLDTVW